MDDGRWLSVREAQIANEGTLIQQHGYRSVLRDLDLASTPQQASAFSLCTLDSISSASPASTCTQALQLSAFATSAGA